MKQRTTATWGQRRVEGSPRLRVLVESHDPALAISDFAQFAGGGLDVALCSGPEHGQAECPLVRGEGCPMAAGADAILFNLPDRDSAVLEAALREHRGTPIVVQLPADAPDELPDGCELLRPYASVQGQISAIRRAALAGRHRREAATR